MAEHKGTAEFVKDVSKKFTGQAFLYRVNPRVKYIVSQEDKEGNWEEQERSTSYVVASSAVVMFSGPETLIFPSDRYGNVLNWGELGGGRGSCDPAGAMRNSGWELAA